MIAQTRMLVVPLVVVAHRWVKSSRHKTGRKEEVDHRTSMIHWAFLRLHPLFSSQTATSPANRHGSFPLTFSVDFLLSNDKEKDLCFPCFWRWILVMPLHPGRLTWNLQITHLERKMIFQTSMIVFHVNLQGVYPVVFFVIPYFPKIIRFLPNEDFTRAPWDDRNNLRFPLVRWCWWWASKRSPFPCWVKKNWTRILRWPMALEGYISVIGIPKGCELTHRKCWFLSMFFVQKLCKIHSCIPFCGLLFVHFVV